MRILTVYILTGVGLLLGACSTKFKSPFCSPDEPRRLPPGLSGLYRTVLPGDDHTRAGKMWNQDVFIKVTPEQKPMLWIDQDSFQRLQNHPGLRTGAGDGVFPTIDFSFGDICSPDGENYYLQTQEADHTYGVSRISVAKDYFSIDELSFNLDRLDILGIKYVYLPKMTDFGNGQTVNLAEVFDPLDVIVDNTNIPLRRYLSAARTFFSHRFDKVEDMQDEPRKWVAVF